MKIDLTREDIERMCECIYFSTFQDDDVNTTEFHARRILFDKLYKALRGEDNAPTVEAYTKEDIAGAYNEGYMCGSRESERPKGEYVDISKLRLMTVEECAGHTIEYAMGWKACVEWIKKGGAK